MSLYIRDDDHRKIWQWIYIEWIQILERNLKATRNTRGKHRPIENKGMKLRAQVEYILEIQNYMWDN